MITVTFLIRLLLLNYKRGKTHTVAERKSKRKRQKYSIERGGSNRTYAYVRDTFRHENLSEVGADSSFFNCLFLSVRRKYTP